MFKELGQIASLLRNAPKMKEEMEKTQQRLAQAIVEGEAGAGMVKVRVNGRMEMLSCTISEEAMQLNDRELLEDLIKGAVNQALGKARDVVSDETGKMASGLGFPGMDFSGMMGK